MHSLLTQLCATVILAASLILGNASPAAADPVCQQTHPGDRSVSDLGRRAGNPWQSRHPE